MVLPFHIDALARSARGGRVRVPGKRSEWPSSGPTSPPSWPRAHDAAMLALGGRSAACLNFPDSVWLLAVPSVLADLADVRRAALAAVADFQPVTGACYLVRGDGPGLVLGTSMFDFDLDMSGEMDMGSYYADLAEELLLEPPPSPPVTGACWENRDYYGDGGGDAALWSYY